MQSLVHRGVVDDRVGDYGYLIVDECHHLTWRIPDRPEMVFELFV